MHRARSPETELALGLLSKAEGKREQARVHLGQALDLAETAEAVDTTDRARQALGELGA